MDLKRKPSIILTILLYFQFTNAKVDEATLGQKLREWKENYSKQADIIAKIQSENEKLIQDNVIMKEEIHKLSDDYYIQKEVNKKMATELEEIKMIIESHHINYSSGRIQITRNEGEISDSVDVVVHKEENTGIFDRVSVKSSKSEKKQNDAKVTETRNYHSKRLLLTDNPPLSIGGVAFFAYLMKNEVSPGQHQTIIFDEVRTNIGGHYSHHTGSFTSPSHGVYVFTWNLYCSSNGYLFSEIVLNSEAVSGIYAGALSLNNILSSTGVAVLELNQGDEIHIRTSPTQPVHGMIYSLPQHRSTFSGWKLF